MSAIALIAFLCAFNIDMPAAECERRLKICVERQIWEYYDLSLNQELEGPELEKECLKICAAGYDRMIKDWTE